MKKDGTYATPHLAEQTETLSRLRGKGYVSHLGIGFDNCKEIIDQYLKSCYA
jgi:hypothetical protein